MHIRLRVKTIIGDNEENLIQVKEMHCLKCNKTVVQLLHSFRSSFPPCHLR